jgi:hypothetical protein
MAALGLECIDDARGGSSGPTTVRPMFSFWQSGWSKSLASIKHMTPRAVPALPARKTCSTLGDCAASRQSVLAAAFADDEDFMRWIPWRGPVTLIINPVFSARATRERKRKPFLFDLLSSFRSTHRYA